MPLLANQVKFLAQTVSKPRLVGAVSPSSRALSKTLVEWIDWNRAEAVVEYGPGTGVVTDIVLSLKRPQTHYFAIEINEAFVKILGERYPHVPVYCESAVNIQSICERAGVSQLDAVICGLPWAAFSEEDQDDLLDAMMDVLPPGGQFVTFAYWTGLMLPAGQRFRNKLRKYFGQVAESKTVWRNLPPAFVYRCRR